MSGAAILSFILYNQHFGIYFGETSCFRLSVDFHCGRYGHRFAGKKLFTAHLDTYELIETLVAGKLPLDYFLISTYPAFELKFEEMPVKLKMCQDDVVLRLVCKVTHWKSFRLYLNYLSL